LQLRNEQGLLNVWIEFVDQFAGASIAAQGDCAETFASQFSEAFFRARYGIGVRDIELVTRIARAIHNNLDGHCLRSFLLTKGDSVSTQTGNGNRAAPRSVVLTVMSNACKIGVITFDCGSALTTPAHSRIERRELGGRPTNSVSSP
jgi:hypothetical protein